MWQNAMQDYLTGQQGAIQAYGQQDLTGTPQYQWAQVPNFTGSPEYKYASVPEMGGTPNYVGGNLPTFARASANNVPGTPNLAYGPKVPDWTDPTAPKVTDYTAKPYGPGGGTGGGGAGGGGVGGALSGAGGGFQTIANLLSRALPGLFGGGGARDYASLSQTEQFALQDQLRAAMQDNPDLWGFGGGGATTPPGVRPTSATIARWSLAIRPTTATSVATTTIGHRKDKDTEDQSW